MEMILLPWISCTQTLSSVKILALIFLGSFAICQNSSMSVFGSGRFTVCKDLSGNSTTPSKSTPPSVLAKAEYVSQMLCGNPPSDFLASIRLFSRYFSRC